MEPAARSCEWIKPTPRAWAVAFCSSSVGPIYTMLSLRPAQAAGLELVSVKAVRDTDFCAWHLEMPTYTDISLCSAAQEV